MIRKIFLLITVIFFGISPATAADTTIMLNVKAGLQFDIIRFRVNPGTKVTIVLTNTDDMSHNLLITKPGTRLKVVNEALQLGEKGPSLDYIPKSSNVLWAMPVVAPNDVKSISFTAPASPGVYPYVCTLPGHGFVMYGAMYVTKNKTLPDIRNDQHVPPTRRSEDENTSAVKTEHHHSTAAKPLHPYKPIAPYFYRVFIEGASPAAIAVNLPGDISYCWDAGTCRLRFAWEGQFLDNTDLWKGKGDALSKVAGTIFFRDNTEYPLSLNTGRKKPDIDYKGYRLIKRYPEFHYTVEGLDVHELILPEKDQSGLIRKFRIPGATQTIRFHTVADDGVTYESSAGEWKNGTLILSPVQAREFSIIMTKTKRPV